jgi:hypothetical protein
VCDGAGNRLFDGLDNSTLVYGLISTLVYGLRPTSPLHGLSPDMWSGAELEFRVKGLGSRVWGLGFRV